MCRRLYLRPCQRGYYLDYKRECNESQSLSDACASNFYNFSGHAQFVMSKGHSTLPDSITAHEHFRYEFLDLVLVCEPSVDAQKSNSSKVDTEQSKFILICTVHDSVAMVFLCTHLITYERFGVNRYNM